MFPDPKAACLILSAVFFAGLGGFLIGSASESRDRRELDAEAQLYRTVARHDKHSGNYIIFDKARHLLICKDCGILICADQAGIVADWSKAENAKVLGWTDY